MRQTSIPTNAVCRTGTVGFACLESRKVISRRKTVCFVHLCVKTGESNIQYDLIWILSLHLERLLTFLLGKFELSRALSVLL